MKQGRNSEISGGIAPSSVVRRPSSVIRLPSSVSRYRGIALMWGAIWLSVLVLLLGLGFDTARVFLVAHQLQNGADAAALAGARLIKINETNARLKAQTIGFANFARGEPIQLDLNETNAFDGDIVIGWFDRKEGVFTAVDPATHAVNAMLVVARRTSESHGPIPLIFGRLFEPQGSLTTSNVGRYAIAMSLNGVGAGLIALRPDGTGLWCHGTIVLDVTQTTGNPNDGAVYINSKDVDGFRAGGTSLTIKAAELDVGGTDITLNGNVDLDLGNAGITYRAPLIPDPLEHVPEPTWDPSQDLGKVSISGGTRTLSPGYYSGGIKMTGGDVTLMPGIYILDGQGLAVNGGKLYTPEPQEGQDDGGVMFFLTGSGVVNLGGNATVQLYAPKDGTYKGIIFFQSRTNYNPSIIRGTDLMNGLDGTLYFPKNHITLIGTEGTIGAQLVAWSIELAGVGDFHIYYDGRFKKTIDKSFLVK